MLELKNYDDISVINLEGELGPDAVQAVSHKLFSLLRKSKTKVVLNFASVDHIHYPSITSLVEKIDVLKKFNSRLKFACINDYNLQILRFVGVDQAVEHFRSVPEAVLSFEGRGRTLH